MTALWTSADAAKATGGESTAPWAANGVSIDTRTIDRGDLFVALTDIRDGHDFVAMALEKGAAAALVTHRPAGVAEDAPLLIVPDVLRALEDLGRAGRARTKAKVIGVTGSVGKTSTKEMLRVVLEAQGKTHAAQASYNNHWGVPLTLARMPIDTEFAVIEIGMNHPGEIAPLAKMAKLDVAMITTVAAAHLEAFQSVEGIAIEKASIVEGLQGVLVANSDLPTSQIIADIATQTPGVDAIWFGERADEFQLCSVQIKGDSTVISARFGGQETLIKLGCAGRHFAMNALGVLAVIDALGADVAIAALDIARWLPPVGRGTREKINLDPARSDCTVNLIDDAFNANPTSMVAALEILACSTPTDGVGNVQKGRRIAILGDMLELGADENAMHRQIAQVAFMRDIDMVHCVGPRMHHLWAELPVAQQGVWTQTAAEMVDQAAQLIDAGDVVLVKGSKGSKVSAIVDAIRKLGHRRA